MFPHYVRTGAGVGVMLIRGVVYSGGGEEEVHQMSAVTVFDSSEANCTESIHDEIWKYITLTQFYTYHFLEIQIDGVSMSCITRNFVERFSNFPEVKKLIQFHN